ncbi:MAG: acyl-CoA dehydrogenase family protein [Boseongicola sp.]|nr:acyl-CoA dehydrogenase family protein [Paracoccaceae bacterium]NNL19206.1 acyl-CoA dehydrogenase family protein [Boseongicola sp.]
MRVGFWSRGRSRQGYFSTDRVAILQIEPLKRIHAPVLGTPTPDQAAFLEPVERFCRDELPALAAHCEETGEPPSREWKKKFAELGVLGINASEEFGGLGLSATDAVMRQRISLLLLPSETTVCSVGLRAT